MKYLLAIIALTFSFASSAGLSIASWNVKHLGWGDEKRDWASTAKVISTFDFVALQEVHTVESLDRLEKAVERQTGADWKYIVSDKAVGRGRYKELYAFIYRSPKVKYLDGAVIYLDPGDLFAREPFAARFQSGNHTWTAATAHLIYGKNKTVRRAEANQLDEYFTWLEEFVAKGSPVLLMGDFNLEPQDAAFTDLKKHAKPLITRGDTTLSTINGRFANLYDNIWISGALYGDGAGILNFPKRLGMTHEVARKTVSDHAPVFVFHK